ncbi:MAG: NAD(P)H-hydrate dehydratase [Eubacterium sp.]|nr:NAD(P)H-hydrate dehydratase [Eubacterium sp.]
MKIVYPREMAEMDKKTIAGGTPGLVLMERAGQACAEVILKRADKRRPMAVVCGGGNNGGDGFVIARLLFEAGYDIKVFALAKPDKMSADARANYDRLGELALPVTFIQRDLGPLKSHLETAGTLVDAVFGTGLTNRPLSPFYEGLLSQMDGFDGLTIAIDIPSGLRGDCGLPLTAAVHADLTVVIQNYKTGCLLAQGPDYTGEMMLVDIGIDEALIPNEKYWLDEGLAAIPARKKYSHKYDYGSLKIVAGSKGMLGAGILASEAALRCGAGLVTTWVLQEVYPLMAVKMPPEIMVSGWDPEKLPAPCSEKRCSAVLLGPGIGRQTDYTPFLKAQLSEDRPLVVDADGLWHLEKMLDGLKASKTPVILTPHTGEFAHLTGCSAADIEAQALEIGADFAKSYGVVLVLKGYTTLVFDPQGAVYFNSTGNPGMATAGSGDVLAGMITALAGRGMDPVQAACAGVYYHGRAGDLYARRHGMESLTAGDIIEGLKDVLG